MVGSAVLTLRASVTAPGADGIVNDIYVINVINVINVIYRSGLTPAWFITRLRRMFESRWPVILPLGFRTNAPGACQHEPRPCHLPPE
jgi:hypothetical protein